MRRILSDKDTPYRQDSCNRSPKTSTQLAGNFLRPESTTAYGRPGRTATQPVQQAAQEIVKVCLPQRIPMHLIPSASVAYLSGQASFGEESVANFRPPCDRSDVYTATKWASEHFLELISENSSFPPGSIGLVAS